MQFLKLLISKQRQNTDIKLRVEVLSVANGPWKVNALLRLLDFFEFDIFQAFKSSNLW